MSHRPAEWMIGSGIAVYVLIAVVTPLRADDPLLERAVAGHRAARQAISSFSCDVLIETEVPTKRVFAQGKYWRKGDRVRVRQGQEGTATDDYLFSPQLGEIRHVGRGDWQGGLARHHKAVRSPLTGFLCIADVWREMLITMPGPNGGQFDYDRILEMVTVTGPAKGSRVDGRECVVVSLSEVADAGVEGRTKVYHDVGFNYLVSKLEVEYGSLGQTGTVVNSEFRELQPGVFFPTRSRRENYTKGVLTAVRVTTLSNVVMNGPVDEAVFTLPSIPNGTLMQDNVLGREIRIDSSWQPIGKPTAIASRMPLPPQPVNNVGEGRSQSTSEAKSASWWVLVIAFVSLAAGLLLVVAQRRRRSVGAG